MEKSTPTALQNLFEKLRASLKESPEIEQRKKEERAEWLRQYHLREKEVSQALLALPVGALTRYQWSLGSPYFYGVVLERRADCLILRDLTHVTERVREEDDPRGEIINMMFHGMPKPSKIERVA